MELAGLAVLLLLAMATPLVSMWMGRKAFRDIPPGQALLVVAQDGTRVGFNRRVLVVPILQSAQVMDIRGQSIELSRKGRAGLICGDNIRANVVATFFVRVRPTEHDVLRVAQTVGCERAGDPETLRQLFEARFSEALKTAAKHFDFEALLIERERFRDEVLCIIGEDLDGFSVDNVVLDHIEQTPIEHLDPDNILDAQGIRKIKEITAQAQVRAAEVETEQRKRVAMLEVECREVLMELERHEAERYLRVAEGSAGAIDAATLQANVEARFAALLAGRQEA